MMWFLLLLLHTAHIELVISEAGNKLIVKNTGDNPCEGHVEVYHNNIWGYVGDADWSKNTEKVVCKSTHCGEPATTSAKDVLKPLEKRTIWLNELKCKGTESALWECDGPGWNASVYQKLTVKKLSCSSKIKISLDGSKCAGAVKYFDGQTSGYFCNNGWDKGASLVCKSLGCGGVRRIPPPQWMESERFKSSSQKMTLNCSVFQNRDPDNLWQCVTGKHTGKSDTCKPASVICEGHQRLQFTGNQSNVCSGQLEEEKNGAWEPVRQNNSAFDVCQQMHCGTTIIKTSNSFHVNCTDEVKVVLMDSGRESKCYGTVHIQVNGSAQPVCASSWGKNQAEFVCKELDCGKLISFTREKVSTTGVMDHVECNGTESSLWYCQAQRDKNLRCSSQPKVVCSGSVKMELVDGPGKCAGRLAIEFQGQWRRVTNTAWTDNNSAAVCKRLNCGQKGKTEKFSQGSGSLLSVDCVGKKEPDISECLKDDSSRRSQEEQAVGITCDKHMVVFLKGPEACSGHVGIKHGSNTYWLSGSNVTWNQMSADTVCQQMQCGTATSYTYNNSTVHKDGRVWNESRSCSSKKESLFNCMKISPPPPDRQNSAAYVNCSGKIVMNLTNKCWGKVKVYTDKEQGDVCADTWTEEKSRLLCENLSCGTALKTLKIRTDGDILFNSVDATLGPNGTLTQWNFVRTKENDKSCNERPAYVICSGSARPRFKNPIERCFGNIEVEYAGQWIPVCLDALKDVNTQNTICRKLECGDAIGLLPYFGPVPTGKGAISSITCSADADSSLSACNIATSQSCNYTGLQCADWKTMIPVGNKACSGTVLVHSGKGICAVSSQGWTDIEKKRLCQNMNCGDLSSDTTKDQGTDTNSFWNKTFSCANNIEHIKSNIRDCEMEKWLSGNESLFIKCQVEPNVSLSDGCRGEVRINNTPVCAQNWDLYHAHRVCQEKHCGNAVSVSIIQSQTSSDIYHVGCDKYHTVLGQCRRSRGSCATKLSIFCSENVKFRTTQKNGGQLEVNYRNKWEKVCEKVRLSPDMMDRLCEEIKKEKHGNQNQQGKSETTLECAEGVRDIKRCVKQHSCGNLAPIKILCPGFGTSPTPLPTRSPPPLAPTIVGVALLLLVLILIALFIRFCVRRARKSKMSSRMLSTKDMEFESGDYEDVMSKENEMEDFSPGRFRSEDEFITDNDGHSVSSLPYDDIAEAEEARPLTSPGTAAPADRDANMHEDGVTYEVENPQESYDDVDTILETTQTKAEVHDSPQTTHDTAAPPGLAQGDEDYLEPDQDG